MNSKQHGQQAEDYYELFLMMEHEEHDEHGREFDQESDFTKDISEMIVTDEAMETMMERMIQSLDKAMAKHADENKQMMEKSAKEKDREEQCEKTNEWAMGAAKAILEDVGVSCDRI